MWGLCWSLRTRVSPRMRGRRSLPWRELTRRVSLVTLVKELLCSERTPVSFVSVILKVFTKVETNVQQRIYQVIDSRRC